MNNKSKTQWQASRMYLMAPAIFHSMSPIPVKHEVERILKIFDHGCLLKIFNHKYLIITIEKFNGRSLSHGAKVLADPSKSLKIYQTSKLFAKI